MTPRADWKPHQIITDVCFFPFMLVPEQITKEHYVELLASIPVPTPILTVAGAIRAELR